MTTETATEYVVDSAKFGKAGLPGEGIYRVYLNKLKFFEGTNDYGDYKSFSISTKLLETTGTETHKAGMLPFPIFVNDRIDVLSDKGIARFRSLYVAASGSLPEGEEINLIALAEEIVGADNVWTVVRHVKNKKTGNWEAKLGWEFSTEPSKLYFRPSAA